MEYNRIVAVTGLSGLFEVLSSKADGAIVRSLDDQSTKFVSSRVHNLSHLESIEVYTVRDNVQLSDVFAAMKAGGAPIPDVKDNKALKAYFEKVFPDLDFERVYSSDMKKMVKWYEVIDKNNIDFSVKEEAPEETEAVAEEAPVAEATAEAPTKEAKPKAKAKKAAPKAEAGEEPAAEVAEKPKRAPRKKKED